MPQPGHVPLPDGESVDIIYAAKGEKPPPRPPDMVPGNEPAAGRVQPQAPENPEPVAGAELQSPANSGTTELPEYQPGDPLPEATVTVEHPDGTVEGPFEQHVGKTNPAMPAEPCGVHERQLDDLDAAIITAEGIWIGHDRLPPHQLTAPVRVEHYDCDNQLQRLVVTYVVRGVSVQTDMDNGHVHAMVEDIPHHECGTGCVCQLDEPGRTAVDLFNRTKSHLRRFVLQRDRDDTGVSGTGVVAEGMLFTDGRVALRWLGERSSIVYWDDLRHVMAVHGHSGATRLRWLDIPDQDAPAHPDAGAGRAGRAAAAAGR